MAGESVRQSWRIVSRGFRNAYDYMGVNMFLSFLWFVIGFAPTGYAGWLALQLPTAFTIVLFGLTFSFLFGPVTSGVYSMTHAIVQGEHVPLREFFPRFRRHYKRSAAVSALLFVILFILGIDWIFFSQSPAPWLRLVSIVWIYFLAFWAAMLQYVFPLIVRRESTTRQILKSAALLVLDNLVVTVLVGVAGLVVIFLSYFFQVPALLFLAGTLGFLHVVGLEELMTKYRRTDDDGAEEPGEGEATT